jgi:hypothetical protein
MALSFEHGCNGPESESVTIALALFGGAFVSAIGAWLFGRSAAKVGREP